MNYSFPIAFLFNNSAITFLLIAVGLLGNPVMAAEIAIIHASTQALFYAFSANARNVILSSDSLLGAYDLFKVRLILVLPLAIIAFFLVDYAIEINVLLVVFMIMRRALDWLTEIRMSEMERLVDTTHVTQYIAIQSFLLFVALAWFSFGEAYLLAGIYAWCVSPVLVMWQKHLSSSNKRTRIRDLRDLLLPHLGSTAVIGIGLYVFRIVITLLTGKEIAGDLFTAFSIGGLIGSVFASSIGPSVVLREKNGEGTGLPLAIKIFVYLNMALGIIFSVLTQYEINSLEFIGKSLDFTLAVGLSMMGASIMVAAQMVRLKIIQLGKGGNVFGADVLMNILLIAVIPYAYYLLGGRSLTFLYLLSAIFAYVFYRASCGRLENMIGHNGFRVTRIIIVFFVVFPIFFMLDVSIFSSGLYNYESQGLINALPLPFSIAACFIGIILLGQYKFAHTSLAIIFVTFALMAISTILSSPAMNIDTKGKFVLLMQFILPYFALVLGQTFEARGETQVIEKTFLIVLLMVIPAQVILTIIHPVPILTPLVGGFSIYQHLQYVTAIFVSAYLIVLFSLYGNKNYSWLLLFLTLFMGCYVGASSSHLTIALFIVGLAIFSVYAWSDIRRRGFAIIVGVMAVASPFIYMHTYADTGYFYEKFSIGGNPAGLSQEIKNRSAETIQPNVEDPYEVTTFMSEIINTEPVSSERLEYWRYFLGKIGETSDTLLVGHTGRTDRYKHPSAHNYYIDFVYHFGIIALLPLIYLVFHTVKVIVANKNRILNKSIIAVTFITLFFVLVDSQLKVGFRQPYPGIFMFFIWGVLLTRLSVDKKVI